MTESRGKHIPHTGTDLLTTKEAAAYLRFKARRLCVLAKEGKIPATKTGRGWRFSREVLQNYVRRQVSLSKTRS